MQKAIALFGGIALSFALAGASSAASFQESMAKCLMKNANTRDAATVMLQCTANGGKLEGCNVVSRQRAGQGFRQGRPVRGPGDADGRQVGRREDPDALPRRRVSTALVP